MKKVQANSMILPKRQADPIKAPADMQPK